MRTFVNYHDIYLYIEPLTDDETDSHKRYQVSNLFMFLEDYLNLTTNQYMRVKEHRDKLSEVPPHSKALYREMNIFFGDIHFLIIAMEKSYSLSIRLLQILDEKKAAADAFESETFRTIKFIRNNLEHMNDKLTREDGKYRESWYSDSPHTYWFSRQWGSMRGNQIKLGDATFDVTESSFEPLWNLYDSIYKIINERYIAPTKETVDKIFKGHIVPLG